MITDVQMKDSLNTYRALAYSDNAFFYTVNAVVSFLLLVIFLYVFKRYTVDDWNDWDDKTCCIATMIMIVIFACGIITSVILVCVYKGKITDQRIEAINLFFEKNTESVYYATFMESTVIDQFRTRILAYRANPSQESYLVVRFLAQAYAYASRLCECYRIAAERDKAMWILWIIIGMLFVIYLAFCIIRRKGIAKKVSAIIFAIVVVFMLIVILVGKLIQVAKISKFKSCCEDVANRDQHDEKFVINLGNCIPNTTYTDINQVAKRVQYIGIAIAAIGAVHLIVSVAFSKINFFLVWTMLMMVASAITFFFSMLALTYFSP